MAVITIKIVVASLDRVLEVFDKIKVYRSTTGLTGTYTELTTPSTRIALESATMIYEYMDTAGDASYFYKTSYFNSVSALESSKSDAQQGEGDPALDVISIEEVKTNYLFGLDLTDDYGTPFPDSFFQHYIKTAVSWIEHRLDLPIRPRVIEDEQHDYCGEDYRDYIFLHLKYYPVIEVEEVKMVLPAGQIVQTFDPAWFNLRKDSGILHIVPGSGQAGTILFGAGGAWLPFMRSAYRWLPDVFRVKYTAGFSGELPYILKDVIGKTAAMGPLNIAGDLIVGAGIASTSLGIDGLSQSVSTTSSATNAGYGARLIQYRQEIKDVIPTLQRYYKGARMVVG
jgi:hypothetical protein